jgi:hypothetical protein
MLYTEHTTTPLQPQNRQVQPRLPRLLLPEAAEVDREQTKVDLTSTTVGRTELVAEVEVAHQTLVDSMTLMLPTQTT